MANNNHSNLKIGESYWFKYKHCESKWFKAKVTHFTDQGYPWAGHGIISADSYDIVECLPEKELIEKARIWLNDKGYTGFAEHSSVPSWMAEFAIELNPEILKKK